MRSSRLLFASAVALPVLVVAQALVLGTPPGPEASGAEVVSWFSSQSGAVRSFVWVMTVFAPVFAIFAGLVRDRLPSPHRDVFFVGAIAFVAETAVSTWIWAGLSWHPDQLEPGAARTLLDITSFWGPVLNGVTITMLAPVVVLSWGVRPVLPRWLGVVGGIALVEQSIETITIFGHSGFTAPGGPMNLMLGAGLCTIWWVCLGITLARGSELRPAASPAVEESRATAT
ncbi:MAG TPA: hypothetical protein VH008_33565 [Pseudonocardia sp.]|nr:hypothetical protein [Pseudonocardia sp.]